MFSLLLVAPYNVSITGNIMYSQEEQLILECHSEGGPQLNYTWIFLGKEIASTATLTIDNVNASNGGNYTCNVTNSAEFESHAIIVYSEFTYTKLIAMCSGYSTINCYIFSLHIYSYLMLLLLLYTLQN